MLDADALLIFRGLDLSDPAQQSTLLEFVTAVCGNIPLQPTILTQTPNPPNPKYHLNLQPGGGG